MPLHRIRLSQIDTDEFNEQYITRQEITDENFNDTDLGLVFSNNDNSTINITNILFNQAKRILGGYRETLKEYNVGDVVVTDGLPNTLRLECVQAGITSVVADTELTTLQNVKAGDSVKDGTVIWVVDDTRDGFTVGDVKYGYVQKDGYVVLDGSVLNFSELHGDPKYLRLYNFAKKNKLLCENTSEWEGYKQGLFCKIDNESFKLPDLRAMFLRGLDLGRGMDSDRELGTYQRGTLVGGTDSDSQGVNHSVVLNNPDINSGDKPGNFKDEYYSQNAYYAYSHRLTTEPWEDIADDFYNIVRPRNVALLPLMKY